jgi:predicted ribosome quality control (RQC) complex YloA/Tae2 family protein
MSLSEKIDAWYGDYARVESRQALLEQAEKLFTARITKMEGALEHLEEKRTAFLHKEQWKHQGDLILSNAHLLNSTSDFLECPDYETGGIVRIMYDPKKSAPENAAAYYSQYKQAATGLADLEEDIKRAQAQLDATRLEWQKVAAEQNPLRVEQLIRKQATPAQQVEKLRPGLAFEVNGWLILVGRNAAENDELLRRHARGQDMWFHTRDVAGGFVFVKNRPGKTIPLDVMLAAGNLAVHFSKARQNREADLSYTQVKHLRRAKTGPKGLVLPCQEKNLFIRLDKDVLHELGL